MMPKIIFFFSFISMIFCQDKTSNRIDYNTALLMSTNIKEDVRLQLDEPKSADIEQLSLALDLYLSLIEKNAESEFILKGEKLVKDAILINSNRQYNPNIRIKKKKNIFFMTFHQHYFPGDARSRSKKSQIKKIHTFP